MTREEKAIIYFKDLRKRFCEDFLLGIPKNTAAYKATMAEKEFYDTAIEALQKEPCGDCISRQEVLDEIDKRFDLAKPFKQLIKSMPPVTPQPKMGRWAVLKDEYGDVIEDVCSNCDKNGNRKWAFCPFCGCKMQEVEND